MHVQCLCHASCSQRWHKSSSIWGYILRIHKNSSTENNQILNPNQMFQWATQNIIGIIFSTWAMKKLLAISKLINWNKDIQGVQLFLALDPITALSLNPNKLKQWKGCHQMKKELKWIFTMMIMLLQFGHMSSYIKIYNLENMLLACITVYGTLEL